MNTPKLRTLRGDCGGGFKQGLTHAQVDEVGLYVPAYRIAPDCGDGWSEERFRRCPVASVNQMSTVIKYYHLHSAKIINISDVIKNPTPALLDALYVLHNASLERDYKIKMRQVDHG